MAFVQTNSNVTPLVKSNEERVKHTLGTSNCTFDPDNAYKGMTSAQIKTFLNNEFTVEHLIKANANRAAEAVKLGNTEAPIEVSRLETTISTCDGKGFVVHLHLYGLDDTEAEMEIEVFKMGFVSHVDYGRQLLPDYINKVKQSIAEETIFIKFSVNTIIDIF